MRVLSSHLLTDLVIQAVDGSFVELVKLQTKIEELAHDTTRHAVTDPQGLDSHIEGLDDDVQCGPEILV
jgi:hypothetical protein